MVKTKKPIVYLVDVENKHSSYADELYRVRSNDEVFLLASAVDKLSLLNTDKLLLCPGKVYIDRAYVGTANALDFQLVSLLGYLICCDLTKRYIMVTRDSGYIKVAEYWKGKGVDVHVCDEIGIDIERVITSKGIVKVKISDVANVADYTSTNYRILAEEANTVKVTYQDISLIPEGIKKDKEEKRELNKKETTAPTVEERQEQVEREEINSYEEEPIPEAEELEEELEEEPDEDYYDEDDYSEESNDEDYDEDDCDGTEEDFEDGTAKIFTPNTKVPTTVVEKETVCEEPEKSKDKIHKQRVIKRAQGAKATRAAQKKAKAEQKKLKAEQKKAKDEARAMTEALAKSYISGQNIAIEPAPIKEVIKVETHISGGKLPEEGCLISNNNIGLDIDTGTGDWLEGENLCITGEVYESGKTKVDFKEPEEHEVYIQKLLKASSRAEVTKLIAELREYSSKHDEDIPSITRISRVIRRDSPKRLYGKNVSVFNSEAIRDLSVLTYYGPTREVRKCLINKYIHLFSSNISDKKAAMWYTRYLAGEDIVRENDEA